jgi:hypothetical protein
MTGPGHDAPAPDAPAKAETWDALLERHTPDVQRAAHAIAGVVMTELPGAVVRFDPGNALLAFGTSGGMRDLVFALIPHARWVNLQLADGAILPDPDGLIEGTGRRIRHVKIHSADEADSDAVREIVRAEVATRR